jgi:hypothetical protein
VRNPEDEWNLVRWVLLRVSYLMMRKYSVLPIAGKTLQGDKPQKEFIFGLLRMNGTGG